MIEPGSFPPVPESKDDLFIASLRHADQVGGLLNDLTAACHRAFDRGEQCAGLEEIHQLLLRQHSDCSGIYLFIAADNLRLDLPPDLRGDEPENSF